MTAPRWFFRFMYDRESAAWERRRDEPEQHELVKQIAAELANVGAEARLPDSVHAAHPSRSKTVHDLEPRYGIEP
jgi:hypothetical protein